MTYIPEVKDLRRAPTLKNPVGLVENKYTVSLSDLMAEYAANPKKFKKKKQLSLTQKQAINCGYSLTACRVDDIDHTFHGR